MLTHYFGNIAGAAAGDTLVDFLTLVDDNGKKTAEYAKHIANFSIEVIGNDADVTVTGKGGFSSSDFHSVTGGTISSGGGMIAIQGFALAQMTFTTAGGAYTINIVRAVE